VVSRDKINVGDLRVLLDKLDGRGYKRYRVLYDYVILYDGYQGYFTKIQADPYAPPSVFEVKIPHSIHRLRRDLLDNVVPLTDYIYRLLYRGLRRYCVKCGSGHSCYLGVPRPSPAMLLRSGVEIHGSTLITRFYVGLPARGRRILGDRAYEVLAHNIPRALSFIRRLCDMVEEIEEYVNVYNDHFFLVEWLRENDGVAFIGDDSVLPRETSISDKPLRGAKPFKSPEKLRRVIKLPSGKTISGMVIPRGLTIITGGGYHGKSTLLDTLAEAIYPHIPGDGREYVVSLPRTFYVEAEDRRIISCVDISSFIDSTRLPVKINVDCFTSLDASGSTSMAASINEVIELGAELLLIDEDTSATNLLYKDNVMEKILRYEPIKSLDKQAKSLIEKTGANLVIVSSASSTYLGLADTIIVMENYIPRLLDKPLKITRSTTIDYVVPRKRIFRCVKDLQRIKARGYKIIAKYRDGIVYEVDLRRNKRIVEKGQVKMIAKIIEFITKNYNDILVEKLIIEINNLFKERGFRAFVKNPPPDLTWVDPVDAIWVLNRLYNSIFQISR